MKPIPKEYVTLRDGFAHAKVTIGSSGVALVPIAGIAGAQKGYSIVPDGDATDWKDSWVVVGHETTLGDPVFMDTEEEEFPIYSAPHGEGAWIPSLVAPSAHALFAILERLGGLAKGRENPVRMEKNPISEAEKKRFIIFLSEFFLDEIPPFWTQMLEASPE